MHEVFPEQEAIRLQFQEDKESMNLDGGISLGPRFILKFLQNP